MATVAICTDFGAPKYSLSLFPLFTHWCAMKWWDWMPRPLFSECLLLSQLFHSPLSLSSGRSLVLLCFLPLEWCHLHIWGCWYFFWQSWFQLVLHPAGEFRMMYSVLCIWASLVAQLAKNTPEMQETQVWSLGWEDHLEKEKATHFSILAWKIPYSPWGGKELDMTE